jgi:hypothetical protein
MLKDVADGEPIVPPLTTAAVRIDVPLDVVRSASISTTIPSIVAPSGTALKSPLVAFRYSVLAVPNGDIEAEARDWSEAAALPGLVQAATPPPPLANVARLIGPTLGTKRPSVTQGQSWIAPWH